MEERTKFPLPPSLATLFFRKEPSGDETARARCAHVGPLPFVMSSEYASPARTETSLLFPRPKKLEIPRLRSGNDKKGAHLKTNMHCGGGLGVVI